MNEQQQAMDNIMNLIQDQMVVIDNDMAHLDVAKAYAAAAFNHKMPVDIRTHAQPKPEWASGGTRNPYGSTKKFNDSRSKMAWVSSYTFTDEDGKQRTETETRNLGRNLIKRTAKQLAKVNGLTYSQSKRLLEAHMAKLEEVSDG